MEKVNIYRNFLKINIFRKKIIFPDFFSIPEKLNNSGKMENNSFFFSKVRSFILIFSIIFFRKFSFY